MTFLLPMYSLFLAHGQLFDLPGYNFLSEVPPLYDSEEIAPYVEVRNVSQLVAEYMFLETERDYRKFLGLDVAANLKTLLYRYDYKFGDYLRSFDPTKEKEVYMVLKVTLKTVNKAVPYDAPQSNGCQLQNTNHEKTHYVKSITYGYSAYQMIYFYPLFGQNITSIRESLFGLLGKHGTLDEEFLEKFHFVMTSNDIRSYGLKRPFGVYPPNIGMAHRGVEEMLELKRKFSQIEETDEGDAFYYEMEPLSSICAECPLVEINRDIYTQLYDVERKYEDVVIAITELSNFRMENLTSDQWSQISAFKDGLRRVRDDIETAIRKMDISTQGSVDQFSAANGSYGNTTSTRKYRRKVHRFIRRIEDESNRRITKRELASAGANLRSKPHH